MRRSHKKRVYVANTKVSGGNLLLKRWRELKLRVLMANFNLVLVILIVICVVKVIHIKVIVLPKINNV